MHDVITIGSATRDVFFVTDKYRLVSDPGNSLLETSGQEICFSLGSKISVQKIFFSCGGGGANAATTFARQGHTTACIGVVGNDLNGIELIHALEKEGIDTSHFQQHGHDLTGYSGIIVGPKGERTILSYKGEGHHFDVHSIPFNTLESRWVYLDSLGGNFDLLKKALDWAEANNVRIASNPGIKELEHGLAKLAPLIERFDILAMNREEADLLVRSGLESGVPEIPSLSDATSLLKIIRSAVGSKPIIIITEGEKGVSVLVGDMLYTAGIPSEAPQVERTGAGDAFNSGFTSEYMWRVTAGGEPSRDDIISCIQFGVANATSVVAQYGATQGILKKGDIGQWSEVPVQVQEYKDHKKTGVLN